MGKTTGEGHSIPVMEETANLTKRVEETARLRVSRSAHTHQVHLDEPLRVEEMVVERVPMDRWVDGPLVCRDEDGTTIFSVVEEVPVVTKRYRLIEEVRVSRHVRTETYQAEVECARTDVTVERLPPQQPSQEEDR